MSEGAAYLQDTADFYRNAALEAQPDLCCTTSPAWNLPGLDIPLAMQEMNYGCGTTVHPRDLRPGTKVLYVGVGAGMEALQFAYFTRARGSVIAVDRVSEMLDLARANFAEAAGTNPWFDPSFIELRAGDALELPVDDCTIDLAAQNCLFNIFKDGDLDGALREMHRVLAPGGRLALTDPVSPVPIPAHLREDSRLRAMCLSGAQTYDRYIEFLVAAGFGTIEVRGRHPYRLLDSQRYSIEASILLDSVEIVAIKQPADADGACVFTGRAAIYVGEDDCFDDGAGHLMQRDIPLEVCDKTALRLAGLGRPDVIVTPSTYHYRGGGCC